MCSFLKQSLPKSSARISTLKRLSWTEGINAFSIVCRFTARHAVYAVVWLLMSNSGSKNSSLPFRLSRWMGGGCGTILITRGKPPSSVSVASCVVCICNSMLFMMSRPAGTEIPKAVATCEMFSLRSATKFSTFESGSKSSISSFTFAAFPLTWALRSHSMKGFPSPERLPSDMSTSIRCLSERTRMHMPRSGTSRSFLHSSSFPKPCSPTSHAPTHVRFHTKCARVENLEVVGERVTGA
mmetsp:Transcript_63679/g.149560  ORF Transcript_63679/g.149560 Transcript_63679/m.149560 type:complete len:240 (-) Transcript_63679:784-1503(-)